METENKIIALISDENRGQVQQQYLTAVTAVDAGGAGDCFFYSLHDALIDRGLKQQFDTAFGTQGTKNTFVGKFRNALAENANDALIQRYRTECENKIQSYPTPEAYNMYLRASANPVWLTHMLYNTFQKSTQEQHGCLELKDESPEIQAFVKRGQAEIKKRGNYIGELEATIAKTLIHDKANIYLDIKSSKRGSLINIKNRIVLYNQGEGHYQFFKYTGNSTALNVDDAFSIVSEGNIGRNSTSNSGSTGSGSGPKANTSNSASTGSDPKANMPNAKINNNLTRKAKTPNSMKVRRQSRRVYGAYIYLLEEVKKLENYIKSVNETGTTENK